MADRSINSKQRYTLGGQQINAGEEWADVEVIADYENDSVQPQITIDNFTFNGEARQIILDWIAQGRIFEGLPLEITVFNNQPQESTFRSILEFTKGYVELPDNGKIEVALDKERSLINFFDKISTISYGYLEFIGVFNESDYIDLDYIVEKKFNFTETVISGIVIYLLTKETAEAARRASKAIADISGETAGGTTGPAGAAIISVAVALIEVIYTLALLTALINLATNLFEFFIPPRRTHKAITLDTLLRNVCSYYGYELVLEDKYFQSIVYLPSNQNLDEIGGIGTITRPRGTNRGIPNSSDRGYIVSEMFEIAKELYDGKYAIINDNQIHLRPRSSNFWVRQSTWEKPDVLVTSKEYNSADLISTRTIEFATDLNDIFTIDNFTGTVVEIRTDVITELNRDNNLLKGLERTQFGLALGNRKNRLNPFEKYLQLLASIIDATTGFLGGGTRFSSRIKNRVGLLKVSQNDHAVAKLLYSQNGRLPTNHRLMLNARYLYETYYLDTSFVRDNYRGQKAVYRSQRIPFGLEDYKQLTDNPYFRDSSGAISKIIKFTWQIESDSATIDYWTREVYTTNLKEIIIEP